MAKLITTYDSSIKEKVFVLKGEEGYARTTDCVLEEILHDGERLADWNGHLEYMLIEVGIDVLRDIGASYVTLYDNDEVLGVYDFDTNTHRIELKYESAEEDNRLKLLYDTEHNIYARYMGNKQCLKSLSKTITVEEPLPGVYESSLSFVDLSTNYDTSEEILFTIKLDADGYYSGQTVYVYNGSTAIGSYITDDYGEATVRIPNGLSDGIYTFYARFGGSDELSACENSQELSVGYTIEITDYPSYTFGYGGDITVKAVDYFGNGAEGKYATIQCYVQGEWMDWVLSATALDSNGVAVIGSSIDDYKFRACLEDKYYSDEYQSIMYLDTTISSLTANPTIIAPNFSTTISGTVTANKTISTPISLTFDNDIGTVTTDTTGGFSATLNGDGSGDRTITATIEDVGSQSVTVEDVLQYWIARGISYNLEYRERYGSVQSLTSGWKLTSLSSNNQFLCDFHITEDAYSVSYTVVAVSGVTALSNNYEYVNISLSAGDKVSIEYSDGVTTYKVNNVVKATVSHTNKYPNIMFKGSSGCYMTVNNVKVKRL